VPVTFSTISALTRLTAFRIASTSTPAIDHAPEIMAFVLKDIVDSPDEKFRGVDLREDREPRISRPPEREHRHLRRQPANSAKRPAGSVCYHDANPDHFAPEIPALTEPFSQPGIAIA